jgi:TolA-binding protein
MPRSLRVLLWLWLLHAVAYPLLHAQDVTAEVGEPLAPAVQTLLQAARERRFGELGQRWSERGTAPLSHSETAAWLLAAEQAFLAEQTELVARWLQGLQAQAPRPLQPAIADALVWSRSRPGDLTEPLPVLFDRAREHDQTSLAPAALWLRGQSLERAERNDEAIRVYHELAERFPSCSYASRAVFQAAKLHFDSQQWTEAEAWATRVVQQYAQAAEAPAAWLLRAEVAGQRGDAALARQHWQALVQRYPEHESWPDAAYRLAQSRYRHGVELTDARELLETFLARPGTPLPWQQRGAYLLAQIALQQGDAATAAKALEQCLATEPPAELTFLAQYWQAELAYAAHDFVAAEARFSTLAAHPTPPEGPWRAAIRHRLALLAAQRNEWQRALDELAQLDRMPEKANDPIAVAYLRGRCLYGLAQLKEARSVWAELGKWSDSQHHPAAAQALWMTGESHLLQRHYEAALDAYDAARNHPAAASRLRAAALSQGAACCLALDRTEAATTRYELLVRDYPDSRQARVAQRWLSTPGPRVAERTTPDTEIESR